MSKKGSCKRGEREREEEGKEGRDGAQTEDDRETRRGEERRKGKGVHGETRSAWGDPILLPPLGRMCAVCVESVGVCGAVRVERGACVGHSARCQPVRPSGCLACLTHERNNLFLAGSVAR